MIGRQKDMRASEILAEAGSGARSVRSRAQ